jgi:surface-anchored protein/LPXTG-motif cell wall-anchored protein
MAPAPAKAAPAPADADGADLIAIIANNGALSLGFRAAQQSTTARPQDIRLGPSGGLSARVPDDPAFAFLGLPGTPVWSVSAGGPRFPAFDTTGVRPGAVRGDAVTLELASVDGPGSFAAYTLSRWGRPTVLLDRNGVSSTRLPAGRRVGGLAWTFGAAGDYRLTFTVKAAVDSGPISARATYLVRVPPIDAATAAPAVPQTRRQPQPQVSSAPVTAAAQTPFARAPVAKAAETTSSERTVISQGHVDMGPQLDGDAWTVRIKDDSTTPATWRELSQVVLRVRDKAKITVPAGTGYAFLGTAGATVWLLPQSQQSGIVWPGWNTQHESVVKGTRGNVTWRLKGVTGPGRFTLFLTGSFGTPKVLFDSAKPLPQQQNIPPNTHAHGNWAFTKAGLYKLAVEMSATTTAGKSVTDTKTLAIAVGDATDTAPGFGSGTGNAAGAGGDTTSVSGADPGSGADAAPGGDLAKTGTNLIPVAVLGVILLTAGAVLLVITRRKATAGTQ